MATPKTTSGAEPLSTEEQQQLEALQARQAAAQEAADKKAREDQLAALSPVQALLDIVMTDQVRDAVAEVMANPLVSFEDKQKVQNFSNTLGYTLGDLQTRLNSLKA